ncbi:MAG: ABC transporter ATP-binding protein [Hahellaceae bacterium]|nr:ABC transporter ATP-binding protein [Hahellaceae bacterium]
MAIIELQQLTYRWPKAPSNVIDIDHFTVAKGEKVFLKGPSGTGKSTLLGLIAGVNPPGSGEVLVMDQPLGRMNASRRDQFRADHLGFIFQMFNLLPYLSVTENVCLPCHFSQSRKQRALAQSNSLAEEARRLLRDLQLDERLIHRPVNELSVGQQQRVAAARALIGRPALVIADEPTSALDSDTRESFIRLLFQECDRESSTLLFVSHDSALSSLFDRHVELQQINKAGRQSVGEHQWQS